MPLLQIQRDNERGGVGGLGISKIVPYT